MHSIPPAARLPGRPDRAVFEGKSRESPMFDTVKYNGLSPSEMEGERLHTDLAVNLPLRRPRPSSTTDRQNLELGHTGSRGAEPVMEALG